MNKGIILFDIDRTIFDTGRLVEAWTKGLGKILNVEPEKVYSFAASSSAGRDFDPDVFTKFLCEEFSFNDQKTLLDVFYSNKNKHRFTDFIFPETIEVFENLKSNFKLGIWSEGTSKYQNYKFDSMNIRKYLDEDIVFILDNKSTPEALKKIPEGSVIVDDKESVCEYLNDNKIKTIWINRKDGRKNSKFETIFTLSELSSSL